MSTYRHRWARAPRRTRPARPPGSRPTRSSGRRPAPPRGRTAPPGWLGLPDMSRWGSLVCFRFFFYWHSFGWHSFGWPGACCGQRGLDAAQLPVLPGLVAVLRRRERLGDRGDRDVRGPGLADLRLHVGSDVLAVVDVDLDQVMLDLVVDGELVGGGDFAALADCLQELRRGDEPKAERGSQ